MSRYCFFFELSSIIKNAKIVSLESGNCNTYLFHLVGRDDSKITLIANPCNIKITHVFTVLGSNTVDMDNDFIIKKFEIVLNKSIVKLKSILPGYVIIRLDDNTIIHFSIKDNWYFGGAPAIYYEKNKYLFVAWLNRDGSILIDDGEPPLRNQRLRSKWKKIVMRIGNYLKIAFI